MAIWHELGGFMCLFNNCCRDNRFGVANEPFFCPRMQAYVVRGPRGPVGPQGPSGLNGIITNNATFAQQPEVAVLSNGGVPLSTNYTLNGTKITHIPATSDINLSAGTYMISYSLSAVGENAGDEIIFTLSLNGTPQNALTRQIISTTQLQDLSGNAIITVPQNSTLSLQNLSTVSVNVENVVLSIVNLS